MGVPVPVLVVDDHAMFAELFVDGLRRAGYDAFAGDPNELGDTALVDLAAARSASVVVLDLVLGDGRSGLDLIGRFVARGCAVVVVSAVDDAGVHDRALAAGAVAVVDKVQALEEVHGVIAAVAGPAGHDGADGVEARNGIDELTPRERQVLAGLVAGRAPKDIAADLGIAVPTVRTQIRGVYKKLRVNNQRAAVLAALRAGWRIGT